MTWTNRSTRAWAVILGVTVSASAGALAQPLGSVPRVPAKGVMPPAADDEACAPGWVSTFGARPGTDGSVLAMVAGDLGDGMALYVAGSFRVAAGVEVNRIARWDGVSWSDVGGGVRNGVVWALAVFDDGRGPALYAGGSFTSAGGVDAAGIARWDGERWSPLGEGVNGSVSAIKPFDDGSGLALYVGGAFDAAGGAPANNIARWRTGEWSAMADGADGPVRALEVFDDGLGSALYAGGRYASIDGVEASGIARWDGVAWSSLAGGVSGGSIPHVRAMTVFNDGDRDALYVGGGFITAGGVVVNNIAKWDGDAWSSLAGGTADGKLSIPTVQTLAVYDDGVNGASLFAGGWFLSAGDVLVRFIGRWDGMAWSALGLGIGDGPGVVHPNVRSLAAFDAGAGPRLYVGGDFGSADALPVRNLAAWDGADWSSTGDGLSGPVGSLARFDDADGPGLYASGLFRAAGGIRVNHIARWDGESWSALGNGFSTATVQTMTGYDDGSGPALYAGVDTGTSGVVKWDGDAWIPLHTLTAFPALAAVRSLVVHDDGVSGGSELYAGGLFGDGSIFSRYAVGRWNGARWEQVGDLSGQVFSLATFDDGAGPALYASGFDGVQKWDGHAWGALDITEFFLISRLSVADDGGGDALYLSASRAKPGGGVEWGVFRLDGDAWTLVGHTFDDTHLMRRVVAFDDGSGRALYASVQPRQSEQEGSNRIVKLNGTVWTTLAETDEPILDLFVDQDDASPFARSLFIAGSFTQSPAGDAYLARYQGCPPPPCPADLNADGVVDVTDLRILLLNKGPCPQRGSCVGDLDGDGAVTGRDVAMLVQAFGVCP